MALQVRVKNKFPSQVVGSGAVTVTKSGGVWTIAGDLTSYPNIDAINDLTMAANKGIYFTDADTAATFDITPAARTLLDDASASDMRTTLGLAIGSDVQAFDADLSALAALAKDDGNIIVGNGTAWVAESGATARTSLGLAIGSDVQAFDADLSAIAALAKTDGNIIVGDGTNWVAESGATARTSLGLAIGTDVQAYNARLADIAGITYAQGDVLYHNGSNIVKLAAGTSGTFLKSQGAGANPTWGTPAGTGGDVVGPSSATDNAIVRYDGTTGKLVQSSSVSVTDSGTIVVGGGSAAVPGIAFTGATSTGIYYSSSIVGLSLNGTAHTTAHPGTGGPVGNANFYVAPGNNAYSLATKNSATSGVVGVMQFFDGSNDSCGIITMDTTANTTAYGTSSDRDLKIVDGPYVPDGSIIDGLAPVTYRWKKHPDGNPMIGFVAQDVFELYPSAVIQPIENVIDHWQIDFSKFVPLIIAELKSLRARLNNGGL